jgi:DNA-binding YbaB/EbfC family protein
MNLGDLFKQAKEIQEKTQALQTQIASIEVEGESGAGLVRVTLNGKGELKQVLIEPSLIKPDELTTIQDLLIAAHADAKGKLERRVAQEMQKLAGSLGLPPGLGLPG